MSTVTTVKHEDLSQFFKTRKAERDAFNSQLLQLNASMTADAAKYEEVVLFSLPMSNTLIKLSEQTLSNLFSSVEKFYPEQGLLLNEIRIIYQEYIGDIEPKYCSDIKVKFCFDDDQFNNRWSSFSLGNLCFNKEQLQLINDSIGVCLNPYFVDSEKFYYVRKELNDVVAKLFTLA